MKKKIIIVGGIIIVTTVIVLGLTVFNGNNGNELKYKTEAVDRGDIEALVVTTGALNPVTIVDVGAQVSGKIEKLYVDFNSQVKEEQILAKLEQSQVLSRIRQNEANYLSRKASLEKSIVSCDNLKKKLDRALNLFETDLISFEEKETIETQYLSAKSDIKSAEASLEQAKSQLETSQVDLTYTIIKSPIDGVVINRNINVGQTVAASFQAPVLFQIANNLSKMQVECSVDEADIGKVKEGQKVRFTVDAFPNEKFDGELRQVRYSPEIVQNVVTYTTIVEVDNPEMKLRPGMTATVSIVTGEAKNALRVSNAALRFNPSLSPEEMRELMASMRQGMTRRKEGSSPAEKTDQKGDSRPRPEGQKSQPGQQSSGRRAFGMRGAQMRNVGRIWYQDENGKLILAFIRTGVTDNTYTEIVSGNLKEKQLVITGEGSESRSSRQADSMGRMMRMFR